ncbi:hypothetical protein [Candidatus Binatus sp.]|uniref:hypothetical protein n=1 Tax=Candidatus Binatus sp. TaxID=2811406 RepID=UPI003C38A288
MGVAHRPSSIGAVAAVMMLCTALIAGTTGTSYAKEVLSDTVIVSNYGAAFAGSLETFIAGSLNNASPFKDVKGGNTLLGAATGPAGDAQSSITGQIAVTNPLQLIAFTPFLNGWISIFSAGANGNSQPDAVIASPTGVGAPDLTGLDLPQGVAYSDGFVIGSDEIAVSNFAVVVVGPDLDIPGLGLCTPNSPGFSLGTITEYPTDGLTPFSPGFNGVNDIPPTNNTPVTALITPPPPALPFEISQNATIGGCDTYLAGPVGVAFDSTGDLFAVNAGFVPTTSYVTAYDPNLPAPYGGFGNALPIAIVGAGPANELTPSPLVDPAFVAVETGPVVDVDDVPLPQDIIFVTDAGDNSIKIFAPFYPASCFTEDLPFACAGLELAEIQGSKTKLKRPQGIAIDPAGNLYVVNNTISTLEEFSAETVESVIEAGGTQNVRASYMLPGVIGNRNKPKMSLPVGLALQAFTPTPAPTGTSTVIPPTPTATDTPTATATPTLTATPSPTETIGQRGAP